MPSLRVAVRAIADPRRRRLAWRRVPPVRPARAAADVDLTRPDPPAASSSGRARSRDHPLGVVCRPALRGMPVAERLGSFLVRRTGVVLRSVVVVGAVLV